jgi:hypothetical protein
MRQVVFSLKNPGIDPNAGKTIPDREAAPQASAVDQNASAK